MTAKLIKYNSLESPNLYFLLTLEITSYKFLLQLFLEGASETSASKGVNDYGQATNNNLVKANHPKYLSKIPKTTCHSQV